MDLKSVARAVESEGMPFLSPDPHTALPGAQRELTYPVEETETPADGHAKPTAIEVEPVSPVVAPDVVEVAPSSLEQGLPDTVHHGAKPDGAAKASIGANNARGLKKRSGGTKPIAGDDIGLRKTAKRAPRSLRTAKVELTSAGDDRAELAELETENSTLRTLLAESFVRRMPSCARCCRSIDLRRLTGPLLGWRTEA